MLVSMYDTTEYTNLIYRYFLPQTINGYYYLYKHADKNSVVYRVIKEWLHLIKQNNYIWTEQVSEKYTEIEKYLDLDLYLR